MRRRIGIAFWLGGITAALALAASASAHTLAGNERAARQGAKLMIARVKLPNGAVRVGRELLGTQAAHVVVRARWRVPESVQQVLAFIEAHRPYRGGRPMAGVEAQSHVFVPDATVHWPRVRGVVYDRFLDIALIPQTKDATLVRATASLNWWVPKSAVADALAGAGALTLTRGSSQLLTTTDPAKIQRIRAMIDALPIDQPGAFVACYGLNQSRALTNFTFYASLGGRELARATVPAVAGGFYCGGPGPMISVPGQEPLYLINRRPSFLAKLGRILGITLR